MSARKARRTPVEGRSCPVEYRADIVPLHRFDLPNAPVTAWKVRILGGGHEPGTHVEWYGPRRESRAAAFADLTELAGDGGATSATPSGDSKRPRVARHARNVAIFTGAMIVSHVVFLIPFSALAALIADAIA